MKDDLPAPNKHTIPRTANVQSKQTSILNGFIIYHLFIYHLFIYFRQSTGENNKSTVKISKRPMSITRVMTHLAIRGKLA